MKEITRKLEDGIQKDAEAAGYIMGDQKKIGVNRWLTGYR